MEQLQWSELNTIRYYQYLNNIINDRGQWNIPKGEYKEGHHIILQCFGGTGNTRSKDPNIIWLYPSEHFIAHKILAEDNDDYNIKMAFSMMAFPKGSTKREPLSAEEYEEARILVCGGHRVLTEEHLAHIRDKMKEIKESGARKGIKKTEEHKRKLSESNKHPHNISEEGLRVLRSNSTNYIASLSKEEYEKHCKKLSDSHKNLLWYNNGIENVRCYEGDEPDGYVRGRLKFETKGCNGYHWYNNGVISTLCATCPDGWTKGMLVKQERERDEKGRFKKRD